MKIAIIGGGIAGNVAADLLAKQKKEVYLFEKNELGGRILTQNIEGISFDRGAEYFLETDTSLIDLIKELNLSYEEYISSRAIFDHHRSRSVILPKKGDQFGKSIIRKIQLINYL
ncbi:MAG: FAD-dependent oxidoreductase, partial [Candidatus Heimdallarchaeota archaeon]|nr:FAD-dependent oxidoreductase [Candidatus Heimdallarchaeota archaeon]